jgi:hypothetical protein
MRHRPAVLIVFSLLAGASAAAQPTPASINVVGSTTCRNSLFVTVNLNGAAPAGGQPVQLSSSLASVIPVPANFAVPAGSSSGNFSVSCVPMAQPVAVTLTATANGASQTALVNVLAPVLESISLKREQTGTNLLGAVRLVGPAPAGGVVVAVTNSHPNLVTIPATVTVPAGTEGTNFPGTNVLAVGDPVTLTITGTALGVTKTNTFTLQPPVPSSLGFETGGGIVQASTSVTGGRTTGMKVTLTSAAGGPSGVTVLLSSNNAAVVVPATTVVANGQTSRSFSISTTPVAQDVNAVVTASVGNTSKTASITVKTPQLISVSSSPSTLIGGQNGQGKVFIDGDAPAGGVLVALTSSNTSRALVPPDVKIASGARDAAFQIASFPLETASSVTLTATAGSSSKTATVSVVPEGPSSLTLNPNSIFGGQGSTGQVNAIASDDSFVVQLTSGDPALVTVPASVSFGPNETAKTFNITTVPVTTRKSVSISARTASRGTKTFSLLDTKSSGFSVTRTATLTLKPPEVTQITLNQTSVEGPAAVTGVVTLNRAAPAGLVIDLRSSDFTVASVSPIAATTGALTHSFTVSARDVSVTSSATITATTGDGSRSATLTVRD